MADLLVDEWLMIWTRKFASPKAQESKPVWDKEKALIEIVKYSTKIFTDPNMAKKGKQKTNPTIYVSALDNVISALKKHRIFDRFGFNLPNRTNPQRNCKVVANATTLKYDPRQNDWTVESTGERVTDFIPEPRTVEVLENHMDSISD
jgi:hypothetical protein